MVQSSDLLQISTVNSMDFMEILRFSLNPGFNLNPQADLRVFILFV